MKSGNYCSKGVQKVARTLQDLLTISTPQIRVGQYDDWALSQLWSENAFTAAVERVDVHQAEDRLMISVHGASGPMSRRRTLQWCHIRWERCSCTLDLPTPIPTLQLTWPAASLEVDCRRKLVRYGRQSEKLIGRLPGGYHRRCRRRACCHLQPGRSRREEHEYSCAHPGTEGLRSSQPRGLGNRPLQYQPRLGAAASTAPVDTA